MHLSLVLLPQTKQRNDRKEKHYDLHLFALEIDSRRRNISKFWEIVSTVVCWTRSTSWSRMRYTGRDQPKLDISSTHLLPPLPVVLLISYSTSNSSKSCSWLHPLLFVILTLLCVLLFFFIGCHLLPLNVWVSGVGRMSVKRETQESFGRFPCHSRL